MFLSCLVGWSGDGAAVLFCYFYHSILRLKNLYIHTHNISLSLSCYAIIQDLIIKTIYAKIINDTNKKNDNMLSL